jgi:hypothetical protein
MVVVGQCFPLHRGILNYFKFELAVSRPGSPGDLGKSYYKSHGYWHFGHGDFIFHNEPNVYLALILFFSPQILGPSLPT